VSEVRSGAVGDNHAPRKSKKSASKKTVIGWSEYIDFPDWHIARMEAKVDTGARTSALHIADLEILPNGEARFHVILSRKPHVIRRVVQAPVLKWARVRSSTGDYRRRCFVKARVSIGPIEKEIELSLVSREKMVFRMLLGRKALEGDFLVDVNKRKVLSKKRTKKKSKGAATQVEL